MIIISPCNLVISKRQSKTFKTSVKVSEDHSIGREVNQRSERKNTTNNSKNCLESDVVVFCLKQNKIQKYNVKINYLPKGINKDYNVIISGKKLLLPTKWLWCTMYEEIKKLTTGHDKDYTSECFVVTQKSTTNWEQLIWIDKEILNTDPKTIQ